MLCITNLAQEISNYIPQIIGIMGTILGTVLGWLLHLISDNMGRTHIYVDQFLELRSNQNEYACIVKLFIYNASHKQQCIRNARFSFRRCKWKPLFESILSEGECSFDVISKRNENKQKTSMVSVNSFAQKELYYSNLIDGECYNKLLSVRKIYLIYEDKKNHKKKKLIKSNFKLDDVERSKWEKFP